MLRPIAVCLLLAWPVASAWAHPPAILNQATEKVVIDEVIEFRKTLAAAVKKKDAAALRAHYADGFVHTEGSGKPQSKDVRIASILADDPVIETAPVTDLVIRVPGGWTAIATGTSPVKVRADGKTYSFRWTAVYVRVGDGWQLAASHATRLEEVK